MPKAFPVDSATAAVAPAELLVRAAAAKRCPAMPGTIAFADFVLRSAAEALWHEDPDLLVIAPVSKAHRAASAVVVRRLTDFVAGLGVYTGTRDLFSTKLGVVLQETAEDQLPLGVADDLYDLQICINAGQLPRADDSLLEAAMDTSLDVRDLVFPACTHTVDSGRGNRPAGQKGPGIHTQRLTDVHTCGYCAPCVAACDAFIDAGLGGTKPAEIGVAEIETTPLYGRRAAAW